MTPIKMCDYRKTDNKNVCKSPLSGTCVILTLKRTHNIRVIAKVLQSVSES